MQTQIIDMLKTEVANYDTATINPLPHVILICCALGSTSSSPSTSRSITSVEPDRRNQESSRYQPQPQPPSTCVCLRVCDIDSEQLVCWLVVDWCVCHTYMHAVMETEPIFASLANILKNWQNLKPVPAALEKFALEPLEVCHVMSCCVISLSLSLSLSLSV
jgi:hypothetical protein